jgi:hypothetical protein
LGNKTHLVSFQQETFEHNIRVQLKKIIDTLRELMAPPAAPSKRPHRLRHAGRTAGQAESG